QECGFTLSTLVSTPVMVNCFWVSNSAFAEWWARAGALIVSSISATVDPITNCLIIAFKSSFLFHDIGDRKHDVRIRPEERRVQIGERLAVERPLDLGREYHPDVRFEVAAVIGKCRAVDVAVGLRSYRHRKANQFGRGVRSQLEMLPRILDRDGDLDAVIRRRTGE